jgi:A/G-specific adenine glycosylase
MPPPEPNAADISPDLCIFFREALLDWAAQNPRPMPWKGERDPYKIWLSEIILQQTRVEQGLPYYEKFVAQFPTARHLADAPEDEVLKLWEGLGYYSRARNLHFAAKQIANDLGGNFPNTYQGIAGLKGVGPYTAAAIASFAFNLPHAVLDGNVYRVLARFAGIRTPIGTPKAQKEFGALAKALLHPDWPAAHNQAIMDFGATCCTPQQPRCSACPLQARCKAHAAGQVGELPVKAKAGARKKRHFHYWVVQCKGQVLLRKREGKDIWRGLWEFPHSEGPQAEPPLGGRLLRVSEGHRQLLTHREVEASFYEIKLDVAPDAIEMAANSLFEGCFWVKAEDLKKKFAFPQIIGRYLQNVF